MERTLFKLSHPTSQSAPWAVDPLLFKEELEDTGFSGQDWDNVPKVAYETALFRKLAPPRMAKVVTNPGAFVLETYGAPVPVPASEVQLNPTLTAKSPPDHDLQHTLEHTLEHGMEQTTPSAKNAEESLQSGKSSVLDEDRPSEINANEDSSNFSEKAESIESVQSSSGESTTHPQAEQADSKADDDSLTTEDRPASNPDPLEREESLPSQNFEEGFQAGLLKGLEQAQHEASEEMQQEHTRLNDQIQALEQERTSLQAKVVEGEVKIDELTQNLNSQKDALESERELLKAQNAQSLEAQVKTLEEVTSKLDDFINHPQRLFEPLKRLSVHLAEQLVLAELNLSGASIERLIQRCLDELSSHSHQSITVELNSQDKARLQELSGEMFNNIQLHAVSSMQPGSVRVITDDTQVDDLIGHRLEALAQNLLAQPELWREQSPFFKQPLAQRDSDFEDVRQRPSLIADKFEENRDD